MVKYSMISFKVFFFSTFSQFSILIYNTQFYKLANVRKKNVFGNKLCHMFYHMHTN